MYIMGGRFSRRKSSSRRRLASRESHKNAASTLNTLSHLSSYSGLFKPRESSVMINEVPTTSRATSGRSACPDTHFQVTYGLSAKEVQSLRALFRKVNNNVTEMSLKMFQMLVTTEQAFHDQMRYALPARKMSTMTPVENVTSTYQSPRQFVSKLSETAAVQARIQEHVNWVIILHSYIILEVADVDALESTFNHIATIHIQHPPALSDFKMQDKLLLKLLMKELVDERDQWIVPSLRLYLDITSEKIKDCINKQYAHRKSVYAHFNIDDITEKLEKLSSKSIANIDSTDLPSDMADNSPVESTKCCTLRQRAMFAPKRSSMEDSVKRPESRMRKHNSS